MVRDGRGGPSGDVVSQSGLSRAGDAAGLDLADEPEADTRALLRYSVVRR